MQLSFNKISGGWYVDLPDWTGAFEDLEMVNGADTLLEILSQKLNRRSITFEVWTSKPDVPTGLLHKIEETLDGATYDVKNCLYYKDTAWLCNVTKFVFGGYHPDDIYFKVAGLEICDGDDNSESQDDDIAIPEDIEYKNIKVTAINLEAKKAVTITADMKQLAKCQTQDAVKKTIENSVLGTKIFHEEDLPKLKYQGWKEVLDEWERLHALMTGQSTDTTDEQNDDNEPADESPATKYDLQRFLTAQEYAYAEALDEMQNGRKVSHWIWYIFPQNKGLGHSYNSQYYGLDGVGEAKAYLQHPILNQRLREICEVLLQHKGKDIRYIMGGSLDAMKLHSSMEIFDLASPNDIFAKVIRTFF